MGGLAAIFNGIGRLFWGSVMDIYGFNTLYGVLAVLQVVLLQLLQKVGVCVRMRAHFVCSSPYCT